MAYKVVRPDGSVDTSSEPGKASVVGGNKMTLQPGLDWTRWAGALGGGAGAYLLAKKLMGDDEIDENGKKKEKGFLKSIVPWLAAIAGGFGGNYLASGIASSGGPGKKGDVAVKVNDDGTVSMADPSKMIGGGWFHGASAVPWTLAAAHGTRAYSVHRHNLPETLRVEAASIVNQGFRSGDIDFVDVYNKSDLDKKGRPRQGALPIRKEPHAVGPSGKDFIESADKARRKAAKIEAARTARKVKGHPWGNFVEGTREAIGKPYPNGRLRRLSGFKSNLILALADAIAGGTLNFVGHKMNADRDSQISALKALLGSGYTAK